MQAGFTRIKDRVGDGVETWLAGMTARTSRRSRLVGATAMALVLHVLLFWMLVATHPEMWNIDSRFIDDSYTPVELWPEPPIPQPDVQPEPIPQVVPREVQPVETPKPADQAPRETQEAPPSPVVAPAPQTVPQPVVQPQPAKPITVNIPKEKPLDIAGPATLSETPAPPSVSTRVKKKTQEEIQAKSQAAVGQVSDLNLHEVPNVNMPALEKVSPSGLAPPAGGGGRLGSLQPPAGLPSGTGVLKGGRGQVTQSLQNHDWCVSAQQSGKPLPPDCQMTDLASQKNLGPKPDADFQAAVAKKDQNLRYKTSPGNTAYWNRVVHVPTATDQRDQAPQPGAYSNAKDQRGMGNGGGTADPASE
ncbi:MAG: hypothetical protein QM647_07580 [Asticcacaulis sp.]|uniref:hypothetical protein n=1 Tax=Asticcacaulis sp. TaxID=1872648 RepID=UPI0039E33BF8